MLNQRDAYFPTPKLLGYLVKTKKSENTALCFDKAGLKAG
jgi:hypothetical protein